MHTKVDEAKIERIAELRRKGFSYGQIGDVFHLSRQRIHQLISDYGLLNAGLKRNGWYSQIRDTILDRDNHICVRCGNSENILIHHLDGEDNNNELNNLVTLCTRCHLNGHRPSNKPGTRYRSAKVRARMIEAKQRRIDYCQKTIIRLRKEIKSMLSGLPS